VAADCTCLDVGAYLGSLNPTPAQGATDGTQHAAAPKPSHQQSPHHQQQQQQPEWVPAGTPIANMHSAVVAVATQLQPSSLQPLAEGDPPPAVASPSVEDGALRLALQGERGEVWVAGQGVAAGYLRDPPLTAQRFRRIRLTRTAPLTVADTTKPQRSPGRQAAAGGQQVPPPGGTVVVGTGAEAAAEALFFCTGDLGVLSPDGGLPIRSRVCGRGALVLCIAIGALKPATHYPTVLPISAGSHRDTAYLAGPHPSNFPYACAPCPCLESQAR
jgi:acyl-CoA synthetase (AMP-forming)/AMP-acid ligase II